MYISNDSLDKLIIASFSALFALVIAQISIALRNYLYTNKIMRLLREELKDLEVETTRILYSYARALQLYALNGIEPSAVVGLSNPIYTSYYKDALLALRQKQRISLQLIHGLVAVHNKTLERYQDRNEEVIKDFRDNGLTDKTSKAAEELITMVKHGYSNCAIIKWHIRHHLNHKNPDLSVGTEHHKEYLKFMESVSEEIERTISSGSLIPREKFEKVYSEEWFKGGAG